MFIDAFTPQAQSFSKQEEEEKKSAFGGGLWESFFKKNYKFIFIYVG